MKKTYLAPEAEVLTFAKEDVITSSGTLFDWDLPVIDLDNGSWNWNEDTNQMKM